jgi:hypothetical protein
VGNVLPSGIERPFLPSSPQTRIRDRWDYFNEAAAKRQ